MPGWKLTAPAAARAALQALPWDVRTEHVPLVDAVGRYLAVDVIAGDAIPAAARAAMDGFAVRAQDLAHAASETPAILTVAGEVFAGLMPSHPLLPGQAVRIPTGGCMPPGADAVVPIEQAEMRPDGAVAMRAPQAAGRHVVQVGEDVRQGQVVQAKGTWLGPRHIGVLAALGVPHVAVAARPRLCVFSSGSEVVSAEATPSPAQVRDVNQPLLAAMAAGCGATVSCGGIVADDVAALTQHLQRAQSAHDVVLLSAGTSVGVRDFAAAVVTALPGATLLFHGVNMRPGKPTLAAVVERGPQRCVIFGLPGFPVSAQVAFTLFAAPLLRRMQGAPDWPVWGRSMKARLERAHASAAGREDLVRVSLQPAAEGDAVPLPRAVALSAGPALVRGLVEADGVVVVPAEVEHLAAGAVVDVWLPLATGA